MQDFSVNVIAPIETKRKIVILASDMLENSTITSFYANNTIRQISPSKELNTIKTSGLFGNFGGAEMYVVGAGMTNGAKKYVDPKKLNALKSFWSDYFASSNANLKYFGTPALKTAIR